MSGSAIDRLAERTGIEPFFYDIWGNRHNVATETRRALLSAMGFGVESDQQAEDHLRRLDAESWHSLLPPVAVLLTNEAVAVEVSLPAAAWLGRLGWRLIEEQGAEHRGEVTVEVLAAGNATTLDDGAYRRYRLSLPIRPPLGYHRLEIEAIASDGVVSSRAASTLIIAPECCLSLDERVPGGRSWGLGSQLYSLRSAGNWGVGDFGDLAALAETAGRLGAGMVGINPLHALFPADPCHFSPYAPSSRTFLNLIHIDVVAVDDLAESPAARDLIGGPAFQRALAQVRDAELVDYPAVARLKRPVLELLYASFRVRHLESGLATERTESFRAFQQEMGLALRQLAVFETLHEHFFGSDFTKWGWQDWPEPYRRPESAEVGAFAAANAERIEFFEYLQWLADSQFAEAAARGRAAGLKVGFYRDLAVSGHPGGAEAWVNQSVVVQGARVGAPPDQFNLQGQNWGLSPWSPVALRDAAYAPFVALLRANMRHAGVLRIDHVMSLQHLFWFPVGGGPGAYVSYPFQDLVRIVALESRRQRCVVIGEDLGTVPEGFRPAMQRAGVLSYRVLYFERGHGGYFLPPHTYPEHALVCVTTHDLATLKGYWNGSDLHWRLRLGMYSDPGAHDREVAGRLEDRWRLLEALAAAGALPEHLRGRDRPPEMTSELMVAVHRYLAGSPSRILLVQLEDVLGEGEQPNLPGTVDQHPNWRRRLSGTVADLDRSVTLRALARDMGANRR
ncbi:4-alpha-glucanotransferase [uncultured Gammaproteobacteria bacterium]